MAADEDVDYQPAGQKKSLGSRVREFGRSIWNPEKKEFIGRTGSSWAKIGLFYLIFYSCLAGFFAIMLTGFFATLSDEAPTQQGMYSLLKGNPGMGFRPMPDIESTLIKFKMSDKKSYAEHIKSIEKLLEPYNKTKADNVIDCETEKISKENKEKEVCEFQLSKLGENCTRANNYGYSDGKPCVLLKMNKIYDWVPKPFDNESLDDPNDKHAKDAKKALGSRMSPDYIGITCEGENEGDADNIYKVSYYPNEGFSRDYFPYRNYPNYQQPLVFVQFHVRKGALIQVWCKLWAKNIKHHKNDKAGSTHFELLVDD